MVRADCGALSRHRDKRDDNNRDGGRQV